MSVFAPAEAQLHPPGPLEVWGGVECTINRVGDLYHNQLEKSGHLHRPHDLRRFAELGIAALRYPVLWEMVAPEGLDRADWAWADERLGLLRVLGLRPIVTLVHHGSGPRHTDLLDPRFPEKLAEYAQAVAERYPWLSDYTPVNEPLTTARFSGLYGHWYPHRRTAAAMHLMLLNELRGTALSMRAVRRVNPQARLIQTEDIGKTYSTPALAYQAAYENIRRWLSLDLLTGRLQEGDRMGGELRGLGLWGEAERVLAEPCPPDVVGLNYYVAGERFLDERLERYPRSTHGGNGRDRYADVEAVRVRAEGIAGAGALLNEAWERYRLPLAITEAHLGCTREEQLRWLAEVHAEAQAARTGGADVRAVTAWSLLGAYDWNSLLTRLEGHYEPGVFDLRGGEPRPTALAGLVRELATAGRSSHPVLAGSGWWRRPERLLYPPSGQQAPQPRPRPQARPVLITGAGGTLGRAFARLCVRRGLEHVLTSRAELDIADPGAVRAALEGLKPWAVVNAAGYVRPERAEQEAERCRRENLTGAATLAGAAAKHGARFLTFSTDLVFDGEKEGAYLEADPTNPLNVYGQTKAAAERAVAERNPEALTVRSSAFFGPWDRHNFVAQALLAFAEGRPFAASGRTVSPTYVPHLVEACLDLLLDGESGLWHLANQGEASWDALARQAAEMAGLRPQLVEAGSGAPMPRRSPLGSSRGALLPSLEAGLEAFFDDGGAQRAVQPSGVGR